MGKRSSAARRARYHRSVATLVGACYSTPPLAHDGLAPDAAENLYAAKPHLRIQDEAWDKLQPGGAIDPPVFDPARDLEARWYATLVCAHPLHRLVRKLEQHGGGCRDAWTGVADYARALGAFRDRLRRMEERLGAAAAARIDDFNRRFRASAQRVLRQGEHLGTFNQDTPGAPELLDRLKVGDGMAAAFGRELGRLEEEAAGLYEEIGGEPAAGEDAADTSGTVVMRAFLMPRLWLPPSVDSPPPTMDDKRGDAAQQDAGSREDSEWGGH